MRKGAAALSRSKEPEVTQEEMAEKETDQGRG